MSFLGQRFILTLANENITLLANHLKQEQAHVDIIPLRELLPPSSWLSFDTIAEQADQFDWLIFTSPRAVKFTIERWLSLSLPLSKLPSKIAVVGKKTAQTMQKYQLKPVLVGSPESAEGLLSKLPSQFLKKEQIWVPCGNLSLPLLKNTLQERRAIVSQTTVYCNQPITENKELFCNICKKANWVVLTAPSVVQTCMRFLQGKTSLQDKLAFAVIGKTTAKALQKYSIQPCVVAKEQTYGGLYRAIQDYVKRI